MLEHRLTAQKIGSVPGNLKYMFDLFWDFGQKVNQQLKISSVLLNEEIFKTDSIRHQMW